MALSKVTYVDGVTIIGAKNLNDIQDELIRQGEQQTEDEESMEAALALKADKETTYTKTEVDSALALKADKSDTYTKAQVDASLALKADKSDTYTKTEVDASLELKADKSTTYTKTEVDSALALKANTNDVNSALALKADKSDTYTKSEVNTSLALKADKSDTYTKTEVDNVLALKADADDVYTKTEADALLDKKANNDGYYEDMTVGNAEQLVTNLTDTESEPFTFRTSGGSLEIGDREELKVVGGSIAWNQIINISISGQTSKGITVVRNSDGSITVSGTATEDSYITLTNPFPLITNHVYYISGYKKIGTNSGSFNFGGAWADTGSGKLAKNVQGYPQTALRLSFKTGDSFDNVKMYPQSFDLTKNFGTEIAEYIHSLEVATTGAGIAFFKKYFPKDYYPYNAGEMLHVQTSEFKTVGFNQWDEEWESGYYDNYGSPQSSDSNIRCKNYIPVLPNETYYLKTASATMYICLYDGNKNFLSNIGRLAVLNQSYTIPSEARYMRFNMAGVYGTTYKNDICISLHWDGTRDGEYEPYTEHSYPLDDSLTLRGVPKLDSDNNLYFDGDTYESDGTVTRKYGIVDLGTQTYTKHPSYDNVFYATIPSKKYPSSKVISDKYVFASGLSADMENMSMTVNSANALMYFKNTSYSDATAFKTAMSGVYLVYELATPTTEEAEPYQTPQIVDNWGTEEFVVPTQSGVEIPVGHETVYPISLRDKVESAPNLPDGDGDYLLHMANGEATYKQLTSNFPSAPTTDGTYVLKATVSNGTATLTWVAE